MWFDWLSAILVVSLLFVTIRFFGRPWFRVGVLATLTGLIGAGVGQAGWLIRIDEPTDQFGAISAGFAAGVMAGALLGVVVYWLSDLVSANQFYGSDARDFLVAALLVSLVLAIPGVGAILFWLVVNAVG